MQRTSRFIRHKTIKAPAGWTPEDLERQWRNSRMPVSSSAPPERRTFDLRNVLILTLGIILMGIAAAIFLSQHGHVSLSTH